MNRWERAAFRVCSRVETGCRLLVKRQKCIRNEVEKNGYILAKEVSGSLGEVAEKAELLLSYVYLMGANPVPTALSLFRLQMRKHSVFFFLFFSLPFVCLFFFASPQPFLLRYLILSP